MKKSVRTILFLIIFASIGTFIAYKFDLLEKIINKDSVNGKMPITIYVDKPKVKIIDVNSNSRPIAVSINNNHAAWPQAGLQDAYLSYELIAEGGITRILAFFKDTNTEKIGSVRSARHYFLDYVLENDAIFVHYGHSPQALSDIKSLSINNINGMYDGSTFYRDKTLKRASEHTAFTTMEKIKKTIKSKGYRTETDKGTLLKYSAVNKDYSKDETSKVANNVSITYSDYQTTSYVYDKENKVYKMYMSKEEHSDLVTKKQYTVKNIITYQVENSSIDKKGRQNLYNTGKGEGYFISNGIATKIKWSKASRSAKTKYTLMDGTELVVNDGNTWIHIQPKNKTLKIE